MTGKEFEFVLDTIWESLTWRPKLVWRDRLGFGGSSDGWMSLQQGYHQRDGIDQDSSLPRMIYYEVDDQEFRRTMIKSLLRLLREYEGQDYLDCP